MKYRFVYVLCAITIFQACSTFGTMQVETLSPSQIDFPESFNKIGYTNLSNPERTYDIEDSLLYNIVFEETKYGFLNAIKNTEVVDSTNFNSIPLNYRDLKLFLSEKVTWNSLNELINDDEADILVTLNSLDFNIDTKTYTVSYYDTILYRKYRILAINAKWSVFNLIEKKEIDRYNYIDTLLWESAAFSADRAGKKLPDFERAIREACYFAAIDYANRVFPNWKSEKRFYYLHGNKDFKLAAIHVKNNNWEEASKLWKKYSINKDFELASRACFNMALDSELKGDLNLAVVWAEKSLSLKEKVKTKDYVESLKTRLKNLKKLQEQIYY